MPIILKSIAGHRRAHPITTEDAEAMVSNGTAKMHNSQIYEESSEPAEYARKDMSARRRGRPPKVDTESTED